MPRAPIPTDQMVYSKSTMKTPMRAFVVSFTLTVAAATAAAQADPAAVMKTFSSSSDITALIAKAKSERKEGQPTVSEPILRLAPYNVNLEYRTSAAPAAQHEKDAELFYVIDGSGTMVTGGKLAGEKRTNDANLSGTAIEGGNTRRVSKGDFIIVPENTPHQITAVEGTLVLMTFHVPRPVGH
jgi:mannose-6-phosphate isomerase-like protein (cupin superfamily)